MVRLNKRQKEVLQAQIDNEKAVLKQLESNYTDALGEINGKIEALLARQDADMQHVIYQVEYQKALRTQVQSILENLQTNEFETISEYLTKSYEDGFIGTMYDLQGQGIPLIFPLDQKAVVDAIQNETKLSQKLYTRLGYDITDLKKKITGEISRGLSTGQMYSEIARNIASWAQIPKSNAMRITRTEAHRIQCKATSDAQHRAKEKGADVVKQWDSTLDSKTRESHVEMDGEIAELDDTFSNGLEYPGDPKGSAEEVINCRCALLQRARWALGNDYTKWSEDAPIVYSDDGTAQLAIIEAKNYKDFAQKYAKAIEKMEESGKIKVNRNYDSELAKGFGSEHYDRMHDLIDKCENEDLKSLWSIYESEIGVGDAKYSGGAHYKPGVGKIYMDGIKDAKGSSWKTPYGTSFHEAGHNIDYVANVKAGGSRIYPFSYTYENNKFARTIKDEVNSIVNKYDAELKVAFAEHKTDYEWLHKNGFMSDWVYGFWERNGKLPISESNIKYSKSFAYDKLQREIRAIDAIERADISDILEGATKGKVQCGFGHGKTYWKNDENLATEAFAEMLSGEMSNQKSLEVIKNYLPKSYEVFEEILKEMKGVR